MRLALSSSVLPKPLVPMTMNLSSRSGVRKASISGVRCSSDSSKSSATRMSSASTVQARIAAPPLLGEVRRVDPAHRLGLLHRLDVEVDRPRLAVAAAEHALQPLGRAGVDLLVRHVGRDVDEVARSGL